MKLSWLMAFVIVFVLAFIPVIWSWIPIVYRVPQVALSKWRQTMC